MKTIITTQQQQKTPPARNQTLAISHHHTWYSDDTHKYVCQNMRMLICVALTELTELNNTSDNATLLPSKLVVVRAHKRAHARVRLIHSIGHLFSYGQHTRSCELLAALFAIGICFFSNLWKHLNFVQTNHQSVNTYFRASNSCPLYLLMRVVPALCHVLV